MDRNDPHLQSYLRLHDFGPTGHDWTLHPPTPQLGAQKAVRLGPSATRLQVLADLRVSASLLADVLNPLERPRSREAQGVVSEGTSVEPAGSGSAAPKPWAGGFEIQTT